jgi:hypothetical protein
MVPVAPIITGVTLFYIIIIIIIIATTKFRTFY